MLFEAGDTGAVGRDRWQGQWARTGAGGKRPVRPYDCRYTRPVGDAGNNNRREVPERRTPPRSSEALQLLRRVRRRLRLAAARFRPRVTTFVYHRRYEWTLPATPLDPQRGERILAHLVEEGLIRQQDISVPRRAQLYNILAAHDEEYVASLAQRDAVNAIAGVELSDEEAEDFLDIERLMAGGTIQATRLALITGGIGVNVGGGFHHAERGRGMAFCAFNDLAVAIRRLRRRGFDDPILVVDLDLHDGNGTRAIFEDDETVHTYSVHNENWAETEAVASTAIALGPNVTDEVYLGTLLKTLPKVLADVKPGLVLYLAGCDPASDDRLGNWDISSEGLLTRDQFVVNLCRRKANQIPMAIVLGGGYGDDAWSYSARFFSWLVDGKVIEPPPTEELTLRRFRSIKASLDPAALVSEPGDLSWHLTEEDLAGLLPGSGHQTRFLRYFSRHGVEVLLERFGILDQLRDRGFRNPIVVLDLDHPMGHTMRIYGDPARTELLVELRVSRNLRLIPGMEVLTVEWLLLQNPRMPFTPGRPRLPGQKHPGLGLLREILGWLVMVVEILDLDGIYYVPSHYHVAAQSRRIVRFLEARDEAWCRALETALDGLSLDQADAALDGGCVMDEETGQPVQWKPCPMVLPVSARLKERVLGQDYEQQVEGARKRLDLGLSNPAHCPKQTD